MTTTTILMIAKTANEADNGRLVFHSLFQYWTLANLRDIGTRAIKRDLAARNADTSRLERYRLWVYPPATDTLCERLDH